MTDGKPSSDTREIGSKGFTQFSNHLLESLVQRALSGPEWDVLLCVLRYTAGFRRRQHPLSLTKLAGLTKRHKNSVYRAIQSLVGWHILVKCAPGNFRRPATYRIGLPEEWRVSFGVTVTQG